VNGLPNDGRNQVRARFEQHREIPVRTAAKIDPRDSIFAHKFDAHEMQQASCSTKDTIAASTFASLRDVGVGERTLFRNEEKII
jgi:hypothetical protein